MSDLTKNETIMIEAIQRLHDVTERRLKKARAVLDNHEELKVYINKDNMPNLEKMREDTLVPDAASSVVTFSLLDVFHDMIHTTMDEIDEKTNKHPNVRVISSGDKIPDDVKALLREMLGDN